MSPTDINQSAAAAPAQENINEVVRLEESALEQRTLSDKVSDSIARFVGSIAFCSDARRLVRLLGRSKCRMVALRSLPVSTTLHARLA